MDILSIQWGWWGGVAVDAPPPEPEPEAQSSGQYHPYAPLFDRALLARLNRRREEELSVAAAFVPA